MSHIGDANSDRKRPRIEKAPLAGPHQPKLSESAYKKAFLLVRIIGATEVDRDFRAVTNERYYGILCWINPGEEYRTRPAKPNLLRYELDPIWNEMILVALGETCVEMAVLRLEVFRATRVVVDPGSSHGRKVVGRAHYKLDMKRLKNGGTEKLRLELLQPGESGWKPEGFLFMEVQLMYRSVEESGAGTDESLDVYDSGAELSYSD